MPAISGTRSCRMIVLVAFHAFATRRCTARFAVRTHLRFRRTACVVPFTRSVLRCILIARATPLLHAHTAHTADLRTPRVLHADPSVCCVTDTRTADHRCTVTARVYLRLLCHLPFATHSRSRCYVRYRLRFIF